MLDLLPIPVSSRALGRNAPGRQVCMVLLLTTTILVPNVDGFFVDSVPFHGLQKKKLPTLSGRNPNSRCSFQRKTERYAVTNAISLKIPAATEERVSILQKNRRSGIWSNIRKTTLPTSIAVASLAVLRLLFHLFQKKGASQRISSNLRFFLTIPILAGVFNAITNRLAVWMMFRPIAYKGITHKIGWQGIVPREVRRMGGDISDLLTTELLDVAEVLKRVDPDTLANLLLSKGSDSGSDSGSDNDSNNELLHMCRTVLSNSLVPTVSTFDIFDTAKESSIDAFLTKDRLARVIVHIVRSVQHDTDTCIDLRHAVVEQMAEDPQLIVNLFQTCGKDELKFMVVSGGYGGALLGVLQMATYAMFPQAWTLVLGGALVGYVTDTLALKIMFAPIEPVKVLGRNVQGLFLRRQMEVSADFGAFVSEEILPPRSMWAALLTGPRRESFVEKVVDALVAELPGAMRRMASPSLKNTIRTELSNIAIRGVDELASHPSLTKPTYTYVAEQLALEENIRNAMISLPSAKFERVLHPVFEQDEAILIAVGSILGGLVGLAQAIVG